MIRPLHWRSALSATLQIAVLCAVMMAFFMRTPQVSGFSMAPHITSGEVVLINTIAYRLGKPARGDVIAFRHNAPSPETYIKRVIGLPGDRVRIDSGRVIVNGVALEEPYVRFADRRTFNEVTVPENSLYVLGDNRADSDDSRFWGFVQQDQVLGKVFAGIWPVARLGAI